MFMMAHGVLHGKYKKWWPLFSVSVSNDHVSCSYDHEIFHLSSGYDDIPLSFLLFFFHGVGR